MPAREAFALAQDAMEATVAANTLSQGLRMGIVTARTEIGFLNDRPVKEFAIIPTSVLKECEWPWSHPVWQSNHAEITMGGARFPLKEYKFFGIRFDPVAVRTLLPHLPRKGLIGTIVAGATPKAAPGKHAPEAMSHDEALQSYGHSALPPQPAGAAVSHSKDQKGPPVSAAALKAWFVAYQAAFTGADDTEARALESARGCFPGKSVSRDAVRDLRGEQKRGPKAKTAK